MAQPVEIALGTNAADPNTVGAGAAIPVTQRASVGGGITWGTYTAVSMTGSSTTLIAANAARKAIRIINTGNAPAAYNLAGGTASLATSDLLSAGQKDWFSGAECPVGAITAIGTSGQTVSYTEGT